MTPDEAANVVEYLNAAFPREALEGESVTVYVRHLAELNDEVIARLAAGVHAKDGDRMPTIAEFRQTYRSLGGTDARRDGERCPHCVKGYVVVLERPASAAIIRPRGEPERRDPPDGAAFEEMGPCPYCEAGRRVERAGWGEDGYWKGRKPEIVSDPLDERFLPVAENLLRTKILMARMDARRNGQKKHLPDPNVGIKPVFVPDAQERMALVQREVDRIMRKRGTILPSGKEVPR